LLKAQEPIKCIIITDITNKLQTSTTIYFKSQIFIRKCYYW